MGLFLKGTLSTPPICSFILKLSFEFVLFLGFASHVAVGLCTSFFLPQTWTLRSTVTLQLWLGTLVRRVRTLETEDSFTGGPE